MSVYYNENDPKAAAWLRELMANNVIRTGDIDERSVEDIRPADLRGYRQCHFFAGIGGWAEALRLARWPIDREVWTGSCPCQPFSAAGGGDGFADKRHLWPAWFHLIEECRPAKLYGEQVDAAIRRHWLDLVQSDMEGIGYAFASAVFPAASVGAPHGRHRLLFVADADGGHASTQWLQRSGQQRQQPQDSGVVRMAEPGSERREGLRLCVQPGTPRLNHAEVGRRSEVSGFWSAADWIYCSDRKYRPVEPGTFPLAHGLPSRMGLLRGYGNAIVPEAAAAFIKASCCD